MPVRGIKGLRGINFNSPEDKAWVDKQRNAGIITDSWNNDDINNLFESQQFIDKFGIDAFNQMINDPEARKRYYTDVATLEYTESQNPFIDNDPNKGVDPMKGLGNDYFKVARMSPENQRAFWESDYLLPSEREEELNNIPGRDLAKSASSLPSKLYDWTHDWNPIAKYSKWLDPTFYGSRLSSLLWNIPIDAAEGLTERKMNNKSNAAVEKAWTRETEQREELLAPKVKEKTLEYLQNNKNNEVDAKFLDNLKFGEGRSSIFAAYFDEDGNPNQDGKLLTPEDKATYLAKKEVYEQEYKDDPEQAVMMLENWGQRLMAEKQSTWRKAQLLGTDIAIGAITYIADQYNAGRRAGLVAADQFDALFGNEGRDVYITNDNKIIPRLQAEANITTDEEGNLIYKDPETEEEQVIHKTKMSRLALDDLGLNEDGEERDLLNNMRYINLMDMYKTANKELLDKYEKLGHSPNQAIFRPDSDTPIFYETAKMASFIAADWALTATSAGLIEAGTELLGKGAKVAGNAGKIATRATNALEKSGMAVNPLVTSGRALEGVGTTLKYAGQGIQKVHPISSAGGIGTAYGRSMQQEMAMENFTRFEEETQRHIQNEVNRKLVEDDTYRAETTDRTEKTFQDLFDEYNKRELESDNPASPEQREKDIANLRELAKKYVLSERMAEEEEKLKNSKEYGDALAGIHEKATNAALVTAATTGLKYAGVNLWGWREYLFKTQAQLAKQAARQATERALVDDATGKMMFDSRFKDWIAPIKELGKSRVGQFGKASLNAFIGGAWTNLTDELQSWGGKQINEDAMTMLMNGLFDPEAEHTALSVVDGIHSYFKGAGAGFGEKHTYIAGLVGGLGAFLPSMTIGSSMVEASPNTNKASWFERNIHPWITNGALSNYYAAKQGERAIQNKIDLYNELWDKNKDQLASIRDLIAIDLASKVAKDPTDQAATDYLKGVASVSTMRLFEKDPEMRALMEKNPIIGDMFTVIEKLSYPDTLDAEERESYISMWYENNPDIARSEENNQEALEELSKRAKQLRDIVEQYDNIAEKLEEYKRTSKEELPAYLFDSLVRKLALQNYFFPEQIANVEEAITGSRTVSEAPAPAEAYGNRDYQQKFLNMTKPLLDAAKQQQKEAEERADKVKEEIAKYNKEELTEDEKKKVEELEKKLTKEQADANYFYSLQKDLEAQHNTIQERLNSEEEERIITADEILRLNPIARATMLDPANTHLYSTEQRAEIRKLRNKLQSMDPGLLVLIDSQARLVSHNKANNESIDMIMSDPYYAAHHQESIQPARETYFHNMFRMYKAQVQNDIIGKARELYEETGISNGRILDEDSFNEEYSKQVYEYFKTLTPTALESFKDLYEDNALPEHLANNIHLINKALEWKELTENVINAEKNNLDFSKESAEVVDAAIGRIMSTTDSKPEIYAAFESILKNRTVSNAVKEDLRMVYDELKGIDNQASAITPMSKKAASEATKAIRAKQRELKERAKKALEEEKKRAEESEKKKKIQETKDNYDGLSIDSSRKSRRGNDITGKYTYTVDDDGYIHIKHEGYSQSRFKIVPSEVGLSAEELAGPKEEYAEEKNWHEVREAFEDGKVSIEKITIRPNGDVSIATSETQLEGDIAKKVYNSLFKEKENSAREELNKRKEDNKKEDTSNFKVGDKVKFNSEGKEVEGTIMSIEDNGQIILDQGNGDLVNYSEAELNKLIEDYKNAARSEVKKDEGNKGESDSLEDQHKRNPGTTEFLPNGIPPSTDKTVTVEGAGDHLLGNTLYGYDTSLTETGKLEARTPDAKGDLFDELLTFLDKENIKLYNIIDEELGDIAKSDPDVHIVYLKKGQGFPLLEKTSLLAVEYTPEVSRLHKNSNGGVFEAQGKKYLLVGMLGYNGDTQKNIWSPINNYGNGGRDQYFRNNPTSQDSYFVDPARTTKIRHISIGHTVKQMPGDAKSTKDNPMPIMELISDPERNPRGYKANELKWFIQRERGVITVNVGPNDRIHGEDGKNKGTVYLLIRGANGEWGPAVVPHVYFNDINNGPLKDKVNTAIDKLASTDLATREQGLREIKGLLWLAKEREDLAVYMGITVGEEGDPVVRLWQNGVSVKEFYPNTQDAETLKGYIKELPFIISITADVLTNPALVEEYSKAGALSVDAANLNKRNADYTVYPIGTDGKAVIPKSPINPSSPTSKAPSSVDTSVAKVKIGRTEYKKSANGEWTDQTGRKVTNPDTVKQLEYRNIIDNNNMQPDQTVRKSKFYVLNADENLVIEVVDNRYIALDSNRAKQKIQEIKEEKAANARESRAAEALNRKPEKPKKEKKEKELTVREKVKDVPEALEWLDKTEPLDIWEAASVVLSSNKLLLNSDSGSIGTKQETGFGEGERRKFFRMFATKENGGKSLQELAEDPMQEVCAINNIDYDNQEARDALIEMLRSSSSPSDIYNYIKNNREKTALEIYEKYTEEAEDRYYWETYGMSKEDKEAYDEMTEEEHRKLYEAEDEEIQSSEKEASDRIIKTIQANEDKLEITEDEKFYKDKNGKLRMRVTSGREADVRFERFPEDSPYGTPSEAIGNSFDAFGRDAFENKLGNRKSLDQRYYNADNESLNHLAEQYDSLEEEILGPKFINGVPNPDRKTAYARDLVITGTMNVYDDHNNVIGEIDVAGTMDLVVQDKNGNFEIYDFKTFRAGAPWYFKEKPHAIRWEPRKDTQDHYHWQLTAYKYLMQQKYNAKVTKIAALPTQAFYNNPNGLFDEEGRSNVKYTSEKVGDKRTILKADGKTVNVLPNMVKPIEFKTDAKIEIRYSKLRPEEQALVRFTNGRTADKSPVPNQKSGSVADINGFSTKTVDEATETRTGLTIRNILTHPQQGRAVRDILKKKFPEHPFKNAIQTEAFLIEKGINVTNIPSMEKFIEDLENC